MLNETKDINHLLKENLNEEMVKMDILIDRFLKGKHIIKNISEHLIHSGGKRLRPSLVILIAKMFGYCQGEDHIGLAASIEFIHTATLLHDDVVDKSEFRRSKKTANNIWGNQVTILVGDYLLSQAFSLMVKTKNLEILSLLSDSAKLIAEGEVMQLSSIADLSLTEERYLEIIGAKTAQLFAASAASGAILSGQTEEMVNSMNRYAYNLGISFQIIDDILDYVGSEEKMGKNIGNDFQEGKVTLPVIFSYNDGSEEDRKIIEELFEKIDKDIEDFEILKEIMGKNQAINKSYQLASFYVNQARMEIAELHFSPEKEILSYLLDFSLKRLY